jgi:Domain of unknown function (DUF4397)
MDLTHHQNCLLEITMFRLLKALALISALALFAISAASCGSGNNASVRAVNGIENSDSQGLDIDVNGTKYFSAVTPGGVVPTPPAYNSVPSGNTSITSFDTGSTGTSVASGNATFSASSQYTLVLFGTTGASQISSFPDNNTTPITGNVEFRVINASVAGPNSVDVYIIPNPSVGDGGNPFQLSLAAGQQSAYFSGIFTGTTVGYNVIVTTSGVKNEIVNQNYYPATGGIITLVLVDNPTETGMSPTPIQLNDLN